MKNAMKAILMVLGLAAGISLLASCAESFKNKSQVKSIMPKKNAAGTAAPDANIARNGNAIMVSTPELKLDITSASIVRNGNGVLMNLSGDIAYANAYADSLYVSLFSQGGQETAMDQNGNAAHIDGGEYQIMSLGKCANSACSTFYLKMFVMKVGSSVANTDSGVNLSVINSRVIGVKITDSSSSSDSATVHIFPANMNPTLDDMITYIEESITAPVTNAQDGLY
jgi:hypothetical protein